MILYSSYDCKPLGSLYGHEDWVVTLTSAYMSDGNIMMISGSQDCKLRIWKIREINTTEDTTNILENLQVEDYSKEEDNEDDDDDDDIEGTLPIEEEESNVDARIKFTVGHQTVSNSASSGNSSSNSSSSNGDYNIYAIYLEAICVGHEDWVTSVQWIETDTTRSPCFISTSMDRNIIIW